MKLILATLVLAAPFQALACPTVNGKFSRSIGSETITVGLYSKVENGQNWYNIDVDNAGPYFVADGQEKRVSHEGQTGTIKVSCQGNKVIFAGKVDDGPSFENTYTVLSDRSIQIESPHDTYLNGTYEAE